MLYTIVTSWFFVKIGLGTIKEKAAQKAWNQWVLRLVTVISLSLQILLILFGQSRRSINKKTIQGIIWASYLCADWIAAVGLSLISHSIHMKEPKNGEELMDFWAPFLLLHLGGPDNITAYSLEDNNLWLRHLLGLIVQGSLAVYVTIRSWNGSLVSILSILMYVPALIKYGERTWALRHGSHEQFRESMLGERRPGPNYATFMEEYNSMEEEGFWVTLGRVYGVQNSERRDAAEAVVDQGNRSNVSVGDDVGFDDTQLFINAHYFFKIFKRLFAFLILSHDEWEESKSIFQRLPYNQAFHMIDIELGFMFGELYTKSSVVYSKWGCILRSVCFSFTVFVFVLFLVKVDMFGHRLLAGPGPGLDPDVFITYLLLVLGIFLEICALVILIYSDSAFLWLTKRGCAIKDLRDRNKKKKRWSCSIAQYSFLSGWLKNGEPTRCCRVMEKLLCKNKTLKRYWYTRHEKVDASLMEFIFKQLCHKAERITDLTIARDICRSRSSGRLLPQDNHEIGQLIRRNIDEVEFDQSLLVWHIVTELLYYSAGSDSSDPEPKKKEKEDSSDPPFRRMCKYLSDYMVYLLLVCPYMLPDGIGDIRLLDTQKDFMRLLRDNKNKVPNFAEACRLIVGVQTEIPSVEVKGPISKFHFLGGGPISKSVLSDACMLASQLGSMGKNIMWETICTVWVEMLSYAAVLSKGPDHAQRLGQGGELLTHVWFLMAHLGITEQFQIHEGAPVKLIKR